MEIGLKRDWANGKWNSTLSVYRILKKNELVADPNAAPSDGLSIELGQKRSQGVEFDLRGQIITGLNLTANYAYTDSRVVQVAEGITDVEAGDIVPGYAKHTVNTWLSYKIQNGVLKGTGISSGFTYPMEEKLIGILHPIRTKTSRLILSSMPVCSGKMII